MKIFENTKSYPTSSFRTSIWTACYVCGWISRALDPIGTEWKRRWRFDLLTSNASLKRRDSWWLLNRGSNCEGGIGGEINRVEKTEIRIGDEKKKKKKKGNIERELREIRIWDEGSVLCCAEFFCKKIQGKQQLEQELHLFYSILSSTFLQFLTFVFVLSLNFCDWKGKKREKYSIRQQLH